MHVQLRFLIVLIILAAAGPADAIQQFIAFFADSKSGQLDPVQWSVSPEGEAVIHEAAIEHGLYGGRIVLIAGDQRVGALKDSIERSQRRANAVRELLVKYGVERGNIFTKPCGFVQYLVETPPETKEPMNRFVLLDFVPDGSVLVDGSRDGCTSSGPPKP